MIYFSHSLPKSEYGVYQNFWVQLTLLSSIGGMGLGLLIFTYPPETLKSLVLHLKRKHIVIYFLILILIGLCFSILHSGNVKTWLELGLYSSLFFIFYTFSILLESFLIAVHRHKLLIISGIIYSIIFVLIGIYTFKQGFQLSTFVKLLLPLFVLKVFVYLKSFIGFLKSDEEKQSTGIELKNVISLWLHLGIYDLLNVSILWVDKFIISLVASTTTAAIYSNGSFNIPFIPIALSAVGNATLMQLHHAKNNVEKARLMQHVGKVLSCIAYPLFFFLLVNRTEFITFVFSSQYAVSVPIFLCSILILPVRAYSNTIILQNLHKGKIINIGVAIDFTVAMLLLYPLYKWQGLAGIALSFVISTYVQVFYYLFYSAKFLRVPVLSLLPLKNWALKAIVFLSVSLGLYAVLPHNATMMLVSGFVQMIIALLVLRYENKNNHSLQK
jgi:O-antigen/teichoic acid export membrane protein